ncbi:MAG TPA: DUF998 domain-containing protein [Candidatus Dormibacteraeota bacterium]|nr:DUF998 domain-containing protein [Candidatus Dormibacteraeota bacterium]
MRRLLYAGVVGPLLFIVVFLLEGATRPGYSAWRHYVSQLATGDFGWMQVLNFLVGGMLVLAFAAGLGHALRGTRGSIGAPVLFGLFAIALLVAGVFSTDPALGYPVGAAPVHTVHGAIHGFAGLAAFSTLPVAAFVMAWHFGSEPGAGRWRLYSLAVGLVIIVFFIASTVASTMDGLGTWHNAPTGFFQRIAIITGWTWIAMVAWRQSHPKEGAIANR